jgi:3,4-dihydroxy 2-butanone 4-phosphate synthase/GTP cyclohydrolase II
VSVAIDPTKGGEDLTSPGHVFPLVARDGGVLVRAGHTEAAVDIARLAGVIPAGVICEVMNDDGTMARLPELVPFAARHNLKIGTITDLIQYRRRTERSVERIVEVPFESESGHPFRMVIYRNMLDGSEHVALVKGRIGHGQPTLVRVHSIDLATDLFRHAGPRAHFVPRALELIGDHDGPGVLVFLRDSRMSWSQRYRDGLQQAKVTLSLREYGLGAQILRDLGVRDMILLSASSLRMSALEGYGLRVVDFRPIDEPKPAIAALA